MFTSIRKYNVRHGSAEALSPRVQKGFVPLMRKMQGFRAYYLLDGGPDVLITISIFDSADEAFASNDMVRCLPDGRWFDEVARTWRDRRGRPAGWPDLIDVMNVRLTRVVLAAAHLDNDPANHRLANLRCLCQRCHMLHDRPFHLAQRWVTYRRRCAIGDLFFGRYGIQPPSLTLFATAYRREFLKATRAGQIRSGPRSSYPNSSYKPCAGPGRRPRRWRDLGFGKPSVLTYNV